jgi:hypothetical protein
VSQAFFFVNHFSNQPEKSTKIITESKTGRAKLLLSRGWLLGLHFRHGGGLAFPEMFNFADLLLIRRIRLPSLGYPVSPIVQKRRSLRAMHET